MNTWDIDTEAGMQNAVAWMRRLLDMSASIFTWGIPRSFAVYQIDQEKKTFAAVGPGRDNSVERVFLHMGFTRTE